MGMVQQLVSVLRTPNSSVHEHVLGVLCWSVSLWHDELNLWKYISCWSLNMRLGLDFFSLCIRVV